MVEQQNLWKILKASGGEADWGQESHVSQMISVNYSDRTYSSFSRAPAPEAPRSREQPKTIRLITCKVQPEGNCQTTLWHNPHKVIQVNNSRIWTRLVVRHRSGSSFQFREESTPKADRPLWGKEWTNMNVTNMGCVAVSPEKGTGALILLFLKSPVSISKITEHIFFHVHFVNLLVWIPS